MLKLQNIEITQTPYHHLAVGQVAEFGVKLTLQVGNQSYNKLPLELSAEDARDVIALAVERAGKMLSIDFDVSPDEQQPAPTPEFAEVDEVPVAPNPTPTMRETAEETF